MTEFNDYGDAQAIFFAMQFIDYFNTCYGPVIYDHGLILYYTSAG
jgi:hypothetical protein